MTCILKYSGEDRDYFLTVNDDKMKPYEYIVHRFHCENQSEAISKKIEIYKLFCKLGLIEDSTSSPNTSHLRTINRDTFRMYILKEYGVDMVSIEKEMNLQYMSMMYDESYSDDEGESEKSGNDEIFSLSSDEEFLLEEESEYDSCNDDLI